MQDDRTAVLARVTGRVQGVGFRVWAQHEAVALGLSGWARNEADGSVRALLVGRAPMVAQMLETLRRGPSGAAVASVTHEPAPGERPPAGFRITR